MNNQLFCVTTNCCAVQRNDTYRIAKYFRLNGWQETDDHCMADMNIVTTCGVTDITEKDSFARMQKVKDEQKKTAVMVISGCLPNICGKKMQAVFPDAVYIPLDQLGLFDELIGASIKIEDVYYNAEPEFHHSEGDPTLAPEIYDRELAAAEFLAEHFNDEAFLDSYNYATQGRYLWKDETIFEVKISSGCRNSCSYCASRLGIGDYRSKPLPQIENEIRHGIALGYKKIMLMGDELGGYGCDAKGSLIDVLKLCMNVDSSVKVGIRYIHPDFLIDLYPQLVQYMDRIFFICVSIQSASTKVLRLMNRSDRIQELIPVFDDISRNYPGIYLHTQIIVGFPNETRKDFMCTLDFLKRCRFDFIRFNAFSARKGTAAFDYEVVYTKEELQERMNIMKSFCKANRSDRLYTRYVQLLWQHQSGKDETCIHQLTK